MKSLRYEVAMSLKKFKINASRSKREKTGNKPDQFDVGGHIPSVFGDHNSQKNLRSSTNGRRADAEEGIVMFKRTSINPTPMGIEPMRSTLPTYPEADYANSDITDSLQSLSSESSSDNEVRSGVTKSFTVYAATRFEHKGINPQSYICIPLTSPLLHHKEKSVQLASLSAWVTILRIMGDLPDADDSNIEIIGSCPLLVVYLRENFNKKYTKKDVDDAAKKYFEMTKNPMCDMKDVAFLRNYPQTILEKIQFVCGLGMYKSDIRDELYCQVMKQLTNNPSQNSVSRGWILLYLMVVSFVPNETFVPCLLQFLQDSQTEFSHKVERGLRRTFAMGTRGFPPGWTEFQAIKNYKPILIPVTLMNGQRLLVPADSATTVQEMCQAIARKIGLRETAGFSLYAAIYKRISCLGDGFHRIMDTVTECEQYSKQMSVRENHSPWRLYFRKEYFTSWEESFSDPVAVDLIYSQMMRGISVSEYKIDEENLIKFSAIKFMLDYEGNQREKLANFIKTWLPQGSLEEKDLSQWTTLITNKIQNDFENGPERNAHSYKVEVASYAKEHLYNSFARFYDTKIFTGPDSSWSKIMVVLHWKGLSVLSEDEIQKMLIPYIEIVDIKKDRASVTFTDIKGQNYTVESSHPEDFYALLTNFVEKLRFNSVYTLCVKDEQIPAIGSTPNAWTKLQRGDLVVLDKKYRYYEEKDLINGLCLSTNQRGKVPAHVIYPLPTTELPKTSFLGMVQLQLKKEQRLLTPEHVGLLTRHTLEEFSRTHFNTNENTVTKFLHKASFKRDRMHAIWQHSNEMIKRPLCKRMQFREELKHCACQIFRAILMYMGDLPKTEPISDVLLANEDIIEPAVRNKYLREEIFCQIVKQLTDNPNELSENKGWQLLWLLTGCVAPGTEVYREVVSFLRGSRHHLAHSCLKKIRKIKEKGCRLYPPHFLEYLALSEQSDPTLKIDIMFPDSSNITLEVDSDTKVSTVCDELVQRMNLISGEGYSLFVKIKERLISLLETDYLFDCIIHAECFWSSSITDQRSQTGAMMPKIVFMRKLWTPTEEEDRMADIIFHYYQEVPNFLVGFHQCTVSQAVKLAALIHIVNCEGQRRQIRSSEDVCVPRDLRNKLSFADWKREIDATLDNMGDMTMEAAKIQYMDTVSTFPTFGSLFFEVKHQNNLSEFEHVYLAVNNTGLSIVDPATKEFLCTFDYSKLLNWIHEEGTFTLITENGNEPIKTVFELEMFQGQLLDDIIMSYVMWGMNSKVRNVKGYLGTLIGESTC